MAEMKITKQHMRIVGSESNELTVHESKTSEEQLLQRKEAFTLRKRSFEVTRFSSELL